MTKLINWFATFKFHEKFIAWWDKFVLKIGIAFLLIFIPLYPKFPFLDIIHTWVYIRLEDFLIAFFVFIFIIETLRNKASIKNALSFPVIIYWLIGLISVIHALLFIVPNIPNVFPHLIILHYLRRIEYMILFFVAASSIKSKKDVLTYILIFILATIGVVIYGFGQKYLGFPAFLTMNEEFAKGMALRFPPRVASTFAGHYDLAAYLVFALAIIGSLIFGFKKIISKIFLLFIFSASFIVLLFTSSRISFAVYLAAISFMLFLQRKKWLIIPVVILSLLVMKEVSGTSARFLKTFRFEPVVYDVKTGKVIATLKEFEARPTPTMVQEIISPTPVLVKKEEKKPVVPAPATPTPYEELPTGTGYIDVPALQTLETRFKILTKDLLIASEAAHLATSSGEFLIKKAIVYDISFTTRFQGEWPRAVEAFKRNILFGSGFSSISLATDNDYLRLLGETGILGFISFLSILFIYLLIARESIIKIDDRFLRSVVIGISAGVFGIALNAVLIDVFEASKVAYILWIMMGITVGIYEFFVKEKKPLIRSTYEVLQTSLLAMIILLIMTIFFFSDAVSNYFTADDFTWLKWAATSGLNDIGSFFTNSEGFFYRPFIKILLLFLHQFFGFTPAGYHIVSFVIHLLTSIIIYFIVCHLTKKSWLSLLASLIFLTHPIHSENILWMSGYSSLFAASFYFFSFLTFIKFYDWTVLADAKLSQIKKWITFLASMTLFLLGLFSYELAVTLPLVIFFYSLLFSKENVLLKKVIKGIVFSMPYFIVFDIYFYLRNIVAQSHFLSGDYSYSAKNFIFNFFGNLFGYFLEMAISFHALPFYDWAREYFRAHKLTISIVLLIFLVVIIVLSKLTKARNLKINKLIIFSLLWFVVGLLPVLGLGNIGERYLYLSSFGFILFIVLLFNSLYNKITVNNKSLKIIKVISCLFFAVILLGFYYQETKQTKNDWQEAGQTVNETLRAISTNYREFPEGSTLYFVNLPLRINRAWIFPTGIENGLWFIYRDETLKIEKGTEIEKAMEYKKENPKTYVFIFEENKVREVTDFIEEVVPVK